MLTVPSSEILSELILKQNRYCITNAEISLNLKENLPFHPFLHPEISLLELPVAVVLKNCF